MTVAEQEEHPVAACPVPHAANQPLPPGPPPVPSAHSSSLRPPEGAQCIFFRTAEDTGAETPPVEDTEAREKRAERVAPDYDDTQASAAASGVSPGSMLVLSSRRSQLALQQTTQVREALERRYGENSLAFTRDKDDDYALSLRSLLESVSTQGEDKTPEVRPMVFPIQTMSTAGDANLRSPLYVIGGEGRAIWTKELEVALREGGVDAIVHSLKDVPTNLPDGLQLGAILEREDPRDALVVKEGLPYRSLEELPAGSVVGTSSVRRVALLRRNFPHLVFSDVRGNINTRLAKLDAEDGPYTALVLASAGLKRMGLAGRVVAHLTAPLLMHSVGQGSLAVEVRTPPAGADPRTSRDARILRVVQSIGNWRATLRCAAERALLRRLEGGCSIPLGVETVYEDHDEVERQRHEHYETPAERSEKLRGAPPQPDLLCDQRIPPEGRRLTLRAVIVSLDGSLTCQSEATRLCKSQEDAVALGHEVADHLEHRQNARAILDEVERHRRLAEEADQRRREATKRNQSPNGVSATKRKEAPGDAPPAKHLEVDRRGVPRDDGQPKAWEV